MKRLHLETIAFGVEQVTNKDSLSKQQQSVMSVASWTNVQLLTAWLTVMCVEQLGMAMSMKQPCDQPRVAIKGKGKVRQVLI